MSETRISTDATKKEFLDFTRPLFMEEADQQLSKLVPTRTTSDLLEFVADMSAIIRDSKNTNLDKFWEKVEKKLNRRQPLDTRQTTDIGKLQVGFSMLYSAANQLDKSTDSARDIESFIGFYRAARDHILSKFVPNRTGKERNTLERMVKVSDNRVNKIADNFNKRLDKGTAQGSRYIRTPV